MARNCLHRAEHPTLPDAAILNLANNHLPACDVKAFCCDSGLIPIVVHFVDVIRPMLPDSENRKYLSNQTRMGLAALSGCRFKLSHSQKGCYRNGPSLILHIQPAFGTMR
jgi:hypothetical protein